MNRNRLLGAAALAAVLIATQAAVLPAAPARAVSSTVVVSSTSATSSAATRTVTVQCPTGSFLYGPGAALSESAGGNVELEAIVPQGSPPNRVTVAAVETDSFAGNWSVTAFAICGPFTTSLQVVTASTASSGVSPKETNVSCPSGLALYGTGFAIRFGNGTVLVHDVLPGVSFAPRSLTVRATNRPGFTPFWGLDAYAVCANPAPSMSIVQTQTALNSDATKRLNEICPAGTRPHGVGAQTFSEPSTAVDGRVVLRTMAALASTVGSVTATENGSVSNNWRLQIRVICAS